VSSCTCSSQVRRKQNTANYQTWHKFELIIDKTVCQFHRWWNYKKAFAELHLIAIIFDSDSFLSLSGNKSRVLQNRTM
jgi:hypothetical protein